MLFAAFIMALILAAEILNGRFWLNDFKVYYSACEALLDHEPVYGRYFGLETGFYKYSPSMLLFFVPYTLVPFFGAAVMHFILIGAVTIIAIGRSETIFSRDASRGSWIPFVAFVCIINHLFRELHLGNVNMLIVACLCTAVTLVDSDKPVVAGILFAAAVLLKPYLAVLCLPLITAGLWRPVLWTALFSAASPALLFPVCGISGTFDLHREWFAAMSSHNDYLSSDNTVAAIFAPGKGQNATGSVIMAACGVLLLWSNWHCFFRRANGLRTFRVSFFCVLAALPNLLITDTEHFLFSLPLICYCLIALRDMRRAAYNVTFAVIMLLYAVNSPDIIGNSLSSAYERTGMLGISNIALIIFTFVIHNRSGQGIAGKENYENA